MMDPEICGLKGRLGRQVWVHKGEMEGVHACIGDLVREVGAVLQWRH